MNNPGMPSDVKKGRLSRVLSPLGVFALSLGCAVGWGAFVMPGTTFLPLGGPLGTAIGIAAGALVMFVIGVNYHYLMNRFPECGGTYSFTKNVFGYDHGFLSSWFMVLVYLAIIWANATAIPLIFRTIFGNLLEFGYLYTVAGYEVYLGEVLISVGVLLLFGLVVLRGGKLSSVVMIVLALMLVVTVVIGFLAVHFRSGNVSHIIFEPAFSNELSPGAGIVFIVLLAPWAFAGFESVSHSVEEFRFSAKKTLLIIGFALFFAALVYILLTFIGTSAVPAGYADWSEYLSDLGSHSGTVAVPVFNGIFSAIGVPGLILLGVAAAAGIITGLVGNLTAASRMIHAMSRDDLLPEKMGALNRFGVPKYAVLFLILISIPIPFLGRSAIGWVIDINTIGVTIAYAYTSAAAIRDARKNKRRLPLITGIAGLVISLFFLAYFLIPNEWSMMAKFSTESYLMLLIWIVLGLIVYFLLFRRDKKLHIGKSTIVWAVMLLLIFFTSYIWVEQATEKATDQAVVRLEQSRQEVFEKNGLTLSDDALIARSGEVKGEIETVTGEITRNTVFQFVVVIAAMLLLFSIYRTMQKRHQTTVQDKDKAEQSSQAKTTFLSNMSHDIRTPMNAITGYVALAKREKDLSPAVQNYLGKIEASSEHLLALINDVLEMSRIESGRMELMPVPSNLKKTMEETRNLFSTQMETKGLHFEVVYDNIRDPYVLCDANRLNRVLLNLISNAYKFTPKGGTVSVILEQTGRVEDCGEYRLIVRDTGIGMSPEFAAKVFEAYERERTATVESIQGTGLGTAITKSIVDLMGGSITVETEQGKGTAFTVLVSFPIDLNAAVDPGAMTSENTSRAEFAGKKLLLVEDNPDNRRVEKTLFEELGFTIDTVMNGEEGVEVIAASTPGEYAAVIMDIEMPEKNGYDATRLIRSLKNSALAGIPVVALTAKAFSEDIVAARNAGMNAHISKPVSVETLRKTMEELLR